MKGRGRGSPLWRGMRSKAIADATRRLGRWAEHFPDNRLRHGCLMLIIGLVTGRIDVIKMKLTGALMLINAPVSRFSTTMLGGCYAMGRGGCWSAS